LLRKGSIFLITMPARAGDHTQQGWRYAVVVTATSFSLGAPGRRILIVPAPR